MFGLAKGTRKADQVSALNSKCTRVHRTYLSHTLPHLGMSPSRPNEKDCGGLLFPRGIIPSRLEYASCNSLGHFICESDQTMVDEGAQSPGKKALWPLSHSVMGSEVSGLQVPIQYSHIGVDKMITPGGFMGSWMMGSDSTAYINIGNRMEFIHGFTLTAWIRTKKLRKETLFVLDQDTGHSLMDLDEDGTMKMLIKNAYEDEEIKGLCKGILL